MPATTANTISNVTGLSFNFTGAVQSQDSAAPGADDTLKWLTAWGLILLMLGLINKTRIGHIIIYYSLWLALVFLLATQAPAIAKLLAPLGTPVPTESTPGVSARV